MLTVPSYFWRFSFYCKVMLIRKVTAWTHLISLEIHFSSSIANNFLLQNGAAFPLALSLSLPSIILEEGSTENKNLKKSVGSIRNAHLVIVD